MEQLKPSTRVCLSLPNTMTDRISTSEDNEQYIINFLQNTLPQNDTKTIDDELRKALVFGKLSLKKKQNANKCSKTFLSARKRKLLGLNKVNCQTDLKYTDFIPLHRLWLNYIKKLLNNNTFDNIPLNPADSNWENVNQQLMKADFHGAKISVVKTKCPSLARMKGIIIQDTKNVFRIISPDNVVRTIPKNIVLLDMHLESITLRFLGKHLAFRPTERTIKKFKPPRIIDL